MQQAEQDLMVIAAQAGNKRAFEKLYQYFQQRLLRFAFKQCGNQALAQDATQEAWIRIAKTLRQLDDPRVFRSWAYRIVRWRTIDLIRQLQRQKVKEEQLEQLIETPVLEKQISDNESITLVINRLPAIEKQVVHLFYLDELSIQEIALILEIPKGTVKSRLSRAREMLKQKFE